MSLLRTRAGTPLSVAAVCLDLFGLRTIVFLRLVAKTRYSRSSKKDRGATRHEKPTPGRNACTTSEFVFSRFGGRGLCGARSLRSFRFGGRQLRSNATGADPQ